jgi:tryptophan 2,3-dioxygenase
MPLERAGASWLAVYKDADRWFGFTSSPKLVDIDDALAAWRRKHVLTVERIIGMKPGTGGSAGQPICARRSISAPSPNYGR